MPTPPKSKANPIKNLALVALVIFALASTGANIYLWQKLIASDKVVIQDENQRLVEEVGKLIELPAGVMPTIAKVDDPEKLKEQGAFLKAQKDDMVLIYPDDKRAILYRPSQHKIIEISAVNITEPPAEPAPTPEPAPVVVPTSSPTPTPVTP